MLKNIATTLVIGLLTVLSIYLIWGWLTINDICTWSAKQGLDSEKVLSYLAQDPVTSHDRVGRIYKAQDVPVFFQPHLSPFCRPLRVI